MPLSSWNIAKWCVILLISLGTGFSVMRNFVICDNRPHGIKFIGSHSYQPWLIFGPNQCLSKAVIGQPRGGDFEPPLPPFPGEPVSHFIQGGTAEVANTSTYASSVALHIPPPSAKTKAPNCEQTPLSPELQLQLWLRGNSLVPPVRVDQFEQLLTGYNQIPKHHLTNSFRFGFQINFIGEITSFEAPNLKSALQNPEILYSKLSKEHDDGRIAGSFHTALFPVFRT